MKDLEGMKTGETRAVEAAVRSAGFPQADAYRFNSSVIRLRVVDDRFIGLKFERRAAHFWNSLALLPEKTVADVLSLFLFTEDEALRDLPFEYVKNSEFGNPLWGSRLDHPETDDDE